MDFSETEQGHLTTAVLEKLDSFSQKKLINNWMSDTFQKQQYISYRNKELQRKKMFFPCKAFSR